MSRSAIIHVGAHKTGTTAIQIELRVRQRELNEINWEIILPPNPKGIPANWNHMFRRVGHNFVIKENILSRMMQVIESSQRDVVVSSEELFFLDQSEIEKFCERIRPFFSRITLVAYVRRQDRMMLAHREQGARTEQSANLFLSSDHPLKGLTSNALRYLDYSNRILLWKKYLDPSKTIVRNYERKELHQQDSVSDFLKVTDINLLARKRKRETNTALSCEAIRFIYELRNSGYTRQTLNMLISSNCLPKGIARACVGRLDASQFLKQFAESNQKLAFMTDQNSFFNTEDLTDIPAESSFPEYTLQQKYEALKKFHATVELS